MICGIDYGSKLAGTTVLAREIGGEIILSQSAKGKDADFFIAEIVIKEGISLIALDAPLSLPGKLRNLPGSTDYFYRDCDRKLKAMSPMFIGGLTARAIRLRDDLEKEEVTVIEAYPKAIASSLPFHNIYQKKNLDTLPEFVSQLQAYFTKLQLPDITNWHQIDAVLAYLIARKYKNGEHTEIGDPAEGVICF